MRRGHTKSRHGCNECKRRKIKCDEKHPQCHNCADRGTVCSFEIRTQPPQAPKAPIAISRLVVAGRSSKDSRRDSSITTFARPSSVIPLPPRSNIITTNLSTSSKQRMFDLQLFHHFTTQMLEIPFEDPSIKETFTVLIPSMALQDACFLDAHLAISALHLSIQNPTNPAMASATFDYIGSAMRQLHTLLLVGLHATNAETACITAILIAMHSCMSSSMADGIHQGLKFSQRWIQPFQGIGSVLRAAWPWVQNSKMVKMFLASKLHISNHRPSPNSPFAFLLEDLDEETDLPTQQAYEFAVAYANCAFEKPRERYLPLFLMSLPPRYVELVNDCDPRSLLILGVHFSLTKMLAGEFLLENTALREVQSIRDMLPDRWRQILGGAEDMIALRYGEGMMQLSEGRGGQEVPQPMYF